MERDTLVVVCCYCKILLTDDNWPPSFAKNKKYHCYACYQKQNAERMWVNGKHISKKHPLHKPGRYVVDDLDGFLALKPETKKSTQGHIYVITNRAWEGLVKIGKADDIRKRFNGYQTYSPYRDYLLQHYVAVDDYHKAETSIHNKLRASRVKGEWFKMDVDEAISHVNMIPQVRKDNDAPATT